MEDIKNKKIVFYDGDCAFCNKSVQFILKFEKHDELFFCSLQSKFAEELFQETFSKKIDLSTFYYWNGSVLYDKSTGFLKLLNELKSFLSILKIIYIFPKKIRDYLYDIVAKNRKKLFKNYCLFLDAKTKLRFIH